MKTERRVQQLNSYLNIDQTRSARGQLSLCGTVSRQIEHRKTQDDLILEELQLFFHDEVDYEEVVYEPLERRVPITLGAHDHCWQSVPLTWRKSAKSPLDYTKESIEADRASAIKWQKRREEQARLKPGYVDPVGDMSDIEVKGMLKAMAKMIRVDFVRSESTFEWKDEPLWNLQVDRRPLHIVHECESDFDPDEALTYQELHDALEAELLADEEEFEIEEEEIAANDEMLTQLREERLSELRVGTKEINSFLEDNGMSGSAALQAGTDEWKTAMDHDMLAVRGILSRMRTKIHKGSAGLTDSEIKLLERDQSQYDIVAKKGLPNEHALFATSRKLAMELMIKLAGKRPVLDIGGDPTMHKYAKERTHIMRPILDAQDVARQLTKPNFENELVTICNHSVGACTCDIKGHFPVLVDSIYDIEPTALFSFMHHNDIDSFAYCHSFRQVDFSKAHGSLADGKAVFKKFGNELVTALPGESVSYVNNFQLTEAWVNCDVFLAHNTWRVYNVMNCGTHVIRLAVRTPYDIKFYSNALVTKRSETIKIKVPVLDNHVVSKLKWVEKELDSQLLRTLLDRNMNASLTLNTLLEFSHSVALTKVSLHDRSYSLLRLDHEQCLYSSWVVYLYAKRRIGWLNEIVHGQEDKDSMNFLLSSLINVGLPALQDLLIPQLPDLGVGDILKTLKQLIDRSILSTDNPEFKVLWDNLDDLRGSTTVKPLDIRLTQTSASVKCSCDLRTETDGDYICSCCSRNTNDYKCEDCKDAPRPLEEGEVDVVKMEVLEAIKLSILAELKSTDYTGPEKTDTERVPKKQIIKTRETKGPTDVQPEQIEVEKRGVDKMLRDYLREKKTYSSALTHHTPAPKKHDTSRTKVLSDNSHYHQCPNCGSYYHEEMKACDSMLRPSVAACPKCNSLSTNGLLTEEEFENPPLVGSTLQAQEIKLSHNEELPEDLMNYAELIGHDYLQAVVQGDKFFERLLEIETRPNNTKVWFAPSGVWRFQNNKQFKVRKVNKVVNSDQLCGYYALRTVYEKTSLSALTATSRKDGNWSSLDLITYAAKEGFNLIVHTDKEVYVHTVDSGTHGTILHSETGEGHWNNGELIQLEHLPCVPVFSQSATLAEASSMCPDFDWGLNPADRLKALTPMIVTLCGDALSARDMTDRLKLENIGGQWWLSNNRRQKHDLRKGFFHLEVSEERHEIYSLLNEVTKAQLKQPLLETIDIAHDDYFNKSKILSIAARLGVWRYISSLANADKGWVNGKAESSLSATRIHIKSHKLKTLDVILVRTKSGTVERVILRATREYVVVRPLPTVGQVSLYIPKSSIGSVLRRFVAIEQCKFSGDMRSFLENNCTAYYGVFGCGKSTEMAEASTKEDVSSLAFTTGALNSLRNKNTKGQILSVEAAMSASLRPVIQIDEATGMTPLDIWLLVSDDTKAVHFYGDVGQIGLRDLDWKLQGNRTLLQAMALCKQRTTNYKTKRVGGKLGKLLQNINPKLELAEHETDYKAYSMSEMDVEQIDRIIEEENITTLFFFYEAAKNHWLKYTQLNINSITVYKVHADQGAEGKNVMVIQNPGSYSDGAIHLDPQFLWTASTRAREKLVWVSVALYTKDTSLLSILRSDANFNIPTGGAYQEFAIIDEITEKVEKHSTLNDGPEEIVDVLMKLLSHAISTSFYQEAGCSYTYTNHVLSVIVTFEDEPAYLVKLKPLEWLDMGKRVEGLEIMKFNKPVMDILNIGKVSKEDYHAVCASIEPILSGTQKLLKELDELTNLAMPLTEFLDTIGYVSEETKHLKTKMHEALDDLGYTKLFVNYDLGTICGLDKERDLHHIKWEPTELSINDVTATFTRKYGSLDQFQTNYLTKGFEVYGDADVDDLQLLSWGKCEITLPGITYYNLLTPPEKSLQPTLYHMCRSETTTEWVMLRLTPAKFDFETININSVIMNRHRQMFNLRQSELLTKLAFALQDFTGNQIPTSIVDGDCLWDGLPSDPARIIKNTLRSKGLKFNMIHEKETRLEAYFGVGFMSMKALTVWFDEDNMPVNFELHAGAKALSGAFNINGTEWLSDLLQQFKVDSVLRTITEHSTVIVDRSVEVREPIPVPDLIITDAANNMIGRLGPSSGNIPAVLGDKHGWFTPVESLDELEALDTNDHNEPAKPVLPQRTSRFVWPPPPTTPSKASVNYQTARPLEDYDTSLQDVVMGEALTQPKVVLYPVELEESMDEQSRLETQEGRLQKRAQALIEALEEVVTGQVPTEPRVILNPVDTEGPTLVPEHDQTVYSHRAFIEQVLEFIKWLRDTGLYTEETQTTEAAQQQQRTARPAPTAREYLDAHSRTVTLLSQTPILNATFRIVVRRLRQLGRSVAEMVNVGITHTQTQGASESFLASASFVMITELITNHILTSWQEAATNAPTVYYFDAKGKVKRTTGRADPEPAPDHIELLQQMHERQLVLVHPQMFFVLESKGKNNWISKLLKTNPWVGKNYKIEKVEGDRTIIQFAPDWKTKTLIRSVAMMAQMTQVCGILGLTVKYKDSTFHLTTNQGCNMFANLEVETDSGPVVTLSSMYGKIICRKATIYHEHEDLVNACEMLGIQIPFKHIHTHNPMTGQWYDNRPSHLMVHGIDLYNGLNNWAVLSDRLNALYTSWGLILYAAMVRDNRLATMLAERNDRFTTMTFARERNRERFRKIEDFATVYNLAVSAGDKYAFGFQDLSNSWFFYRSLDEATNHRDVNTKLGTALIHDHIVYILDGSYIPVAPYSDWHLVVLDLDAFVKKTYDLEIERIGALTPKIVTDLFKWAYSGRGNPFDNLIIPFDKHRTNQTTVFKHIQKYANKLNIATVKARSKVLYVTQNTTKYLMRDKYILEAANLQEQVDSTMGGDALDAIDSMLFHLADTVFRSQYTIVSSSMGAIAVTSKLNYPIIHGLSNHSIDRWGKTSRVAIPYLTSLCVTLSESSNENARIVGQWLDTELKKSYPAWQMNTNVMSTFNVISASQCGVSIPTLIDRMPNNSMCIIAFPKLGDHLTHSTMRQGSEVVVNYNDVDLQISVHPDNIKMMNELQLEGTQLKIVSDMMGHYFIEVVKTDKPTRLNKYLSDPEVHSARLVHYTLPKLDTTMVKWLEGKPMSLCDVYVPENVDNLLCLRAQRPGCTWEDQKQYARTLRQTTIYNTRRTANLYKSTSDEMLIWAAVTYLHVQHTVNPIYNISQTKFADEHRKMGLSSILYHRLKDIMGAVTMEVTSRLGLNKSWLDLAMQLNDLIEDVSGNNKIGDILLLAKKYQVRRVVHLRDITRSEDQTSWYTNGFKGQLRAPKTNRPSKLPEETNQTLLPNVAIKQTVFSEVVVISGSGVFKQTLVDIANSLELPTVECDSHFSSSRRIRAQDVAVLLKNISDRKRTLAAYDVICCADSDWATIAAAILTKKKLHVLYTMEPSLIAKRMLDDITYYTSPFEDEHINGNTERILNSLRNWIPSLDFETWPIKKTMFIESSLAHLINDETVTENMRTYESSITTGAGHGSTLTHDNAMTYSESIKLDLWDLESWISGLENSSCHITSNLISLGICLKNGIPCYVSGPIHQLPSCFTLPDTDSKRYEQRHLSSMRQLNDRPSKTHIETVIEATLSRVDRLHSGVQISSATMPNLMPIRMSIPEREDDTHSLGYDKTAGRLMSVTAAIVCLTEGPVLFNNSWLDVDEIISLVEAQRFNALVTLVVNESGHVLVMYKRQGSMSWTIKEVVEQLNSSAEADEFSWLTKFKPGMYTTTHLPVLDLRYSGEVRFKDPLEHLYSNNNQEGQTPQRVRTITNVMSTANILGSVGGPGSAVTKETTALTTALESPEVLFNTKAHDGSESEETVESERTAHDTTEPPESAPVAQEQPPVVSQQVPLTEQTTDEAENLLLEQLFDNLENEVGALVATFSSFDLADMESMKFDNGEIIKHTNHYSPSDGMCWKKAVSFLGIELPGNEDGMSPENLMSLLTRAEKTFAVKEGNVLHIFHDSTIPLTSQEYKCISLELADVAGLHWQVGVSVFRVVDADQRIGSGKVIIDVNCSKAGKGYELKGRTEGPCVDHTHAPLLDNLTSLLNNQFVKTSLFSKSHMEFNSLMTKHSTLKFRFETQTNPVMFMNMEARYDGLVSNTTGFKNLRGVLVVTHNGVFKGVALNQDSKQVIFIAHDVKSGAQMGINNSSRSNTRMIIDVRAPIGTYAKRSKINITAEVMGVADLTLPLNKQTAIFLKMPAGSRIKQIGDKANLIVAHYDNYQHHKLEGRRDEREIIEDTLERGYSVECQPAWMWPLIVKQATEYVRPQIKSGRPIITFSCKHILANTYARARNLDWDESDSLINSVSISREIVEDSVEQISHQVDVSRLLMHLSDGAEVLPVTNHYYGEEVVGHPERPYRGTYTISEPTEFTNPADVINGDHVLMSDLEPYLEVLNVKYSTEFELTKLGLYANCSESTMEYILSSSIGYQTDESSEYDIFIPIFDEYDDKGVYSFLLQVSASWFFSTHKYGEVMTGRDLEMYLCHHDSYFNRRTRYGQDKILRQAELYSIHSTLNIRVPDALEFYQPGEDFEFSNGSMGYYVKRYGEQGGRAEGENVVELQEEDRDMWFLDRGNADLSIRQVGHLAPRAIVALASGGGKTTLVKLFPLLFHDPDASVILQLIAEPEEMTMDDWRLRNEQVRRQLYADRANIAGKVLMVWHPENVPEMWSHVKMVIITIDDKSGLRMFDLNNQSLLDYCKQYPRTEHWHIQRSEVPDKLIDRFYPEYKSRDASIQAINVFNALCLEDVTYQSNVISDKPLTKLFLPYVAATATSVEVAEGVLGEPEQANIQSMDFFTTTDKTDWLEVRLPQTDMRIKSKEVFGSYGVEKKTILTKYPVWSRPVFTKVQFAVLNSITTRFGQVQVLRKRQIDCLHHIEKMKRAYFVPTCEQLISKFKKRPLKIDAKETQKWLAKRPDRNKVTNDLLEILEEGVGVHRVNAIKIHAKLESLLKEDPITMPEEQKVRLIAWQRYGLAAIYSPVFLEAKKRLKQLLKDTVIYADGYTANELSARLRQVSGTTRFFESDLAKQDRQTDNEMLDLEFHVYDMLGVSNEVLSSWRAVHRNWRWKSDLHSGYRDAMRLTGQATTALGNLIVNMAVHTDIVLENMSKIFLILMLGDDNMFLTSAFLDLIGFKRDTEELFNMEVTPDSHTTHGTFIQLIAYKTPEGTCEMAPDWVRLARRYEVTNGASESTPDNLHARAMSYCMMLGAIPEVNALVARKNWPIKPFQWYEPGQAKIAMAAKHNTTTAEIEIRLKHLINMMELDAGHEVAWEIPLPLTSKLAARQDKKIN
uniref:Polyprotein n=1 Tax=Rhizoctonia solani endornavirus 5 TaxID=2599611 RepID=A0A5B8GAX5_9VIRU|nr:polyprotein [Rhizoctonia solani endornavirus 5]